MTLDVDWTLNNNKEAIIFVVVVDLNPRRAINPVLTYGRASTELVPDTAAGGACD